jgi:hypothetical protein
VPVKVLVGLGFIGAAIWLNRSDRASALGDRDGVPDDLYDLFNEYLNANDQLQRRISTYPIAEAKRAVTEFRQKQCRVDPDNMTPDERKSYEYDRSEMEIELGHQCLEVKATHRGMRDAYQKYVRPVHRHPDFGKMVKAIEKSGNEENIDYLHRARERINDAVANGDRWSKWWRENIVEGLTRCDHVLPDGTSCEEAEGPWDLPTGLLGLGVGRGWRRARCIHCKKPIDADDYYMVKNHLWLLASGSEDQGQMHWKCLSNRLDQKGHVLTTKDLTDCIANMYFLAKRDTP